MRRVEHEVLLVQARLAARSTAGVVRGDRHRKHRRRRNVTAVVRLIAAALARAVRKRLLLGVVLGAADCDAQLRAVPGDVLRRQPRALRLRKGAEARVGDLRTRLARVVGPVVDLVLQELDEQASTP